MKRAIRIILLFTLLIALPAVAQRPQLGKLSPWLRQLARENSRETSFSSHSSYSRNSSQISNSRKTLIAFIKTTSDGTKALDEHQCRSLARFGNLHIASIPVDQLPSLSNDRRVLRVEASPSNHLCLDSVAIQLNATKVYQGEGLLPQAYSGRDVVMGIMDIGFDLTHPNFYSRDTTDYRIRRFWDQLSQDTLNSTFPVGRDYVTKAEILSLGHSRDGNDLEHGTHTLGIAAGSGYDSSYRGIAPEADICLVANAVREDKPYIDSTDYYKYTFATDALGFKYIFDYAESVGKPCVISFSEGSQQDFYGYDQLYYEMLDSLTGPGRILVASSGNEGAQKNYIHKLPGEESTGTFLRCGETSMTVVMKSRDDFTLRLVAYTAPNDTLEVSLSQVLCQPDSTLFLVTPTFNALLEAYPSSYHPEETCLDLMVITEDPVGATPRLSMELTGIDSDVEVWRMDGLFSTYPVNPLLTAGETSHYVLSPSSAPCVIGVGATCYRDHVVNLNGKEYAYSQGTDGRLAHYSSTGPTFDGRIKPDCVAPGNYIISSYSSFKLENHPDDVAMHTRHFPFNGRTHVWGANSGTSMSAPAVGGAIALWLQACPTLTADDVRGILHRTCHHYDTTLDYPNNLYGEGEVDVYAGLLDILGLSSIHDISRQHTQATVTVSNSRMHIVLTETTTANLTVRLYDLGGRPVFQSIIPPGSQTYTFTLPPLSNGVFAVCIGNESTLYRITR